jgi:hypothetical protein
MYPPLNRLAGHFLTQLADASMRAVVLTALVALVLIFLRRRPAVQHAMWTVVAAGMLALPGLRPMIPIAHLPLTEPTAWGAFHAGGEQAGAIPDGPLPSISLARPKSSPFPLGWPSYVGMAYLTGLLIFAARLILGLFLTRRWLGSSRSIRAELSTFSLPIDAGADIRESDRVRIPIATGIIRMKVTLPSEWRDWPMSKVLAVLTHELAHARRRDPAVALLAAVNKGVFWFHPLAWWLEQHLAELAEHAADDAGMAASSDAESYARTVVEMASRMRRGPNRLIWNSAAMSGPLVARRVRRILDSSTVKSARRLGWFARAVLAFSAMLLVWITAAAHFQTSARAETKRTGAAANGSQLLRNVAAHQDAAAPQYEIAELKFEGDPRLALAEENRIAAALKQKTYSGDLGDVQDEILERIRMEWQDRGHFKAIVTGDARVLTSGPVQARLFVTARIDGGPTYALGGISFKHNRVITDKALRGLFPLKDGELFNRSAIAHGLEDLRAAYLELGYVSFTMVPGTRFDEKKRLGYVDVGLDEGKQFYVGSITFLGVDQNVVAGLLRLKVGDVYSRRRVALLFSEHGDLLPAGSSLDRNVHLQPDAAAGAVAVTLDFRQHPDQ